MEKNRIFLSHAVKDKKLADMLVDLATSCGVMSPNEIFCTSLEGLGVPPGEDFLEVIKKELQEPELVISLISGNYLQSQFCLCELGASWAMSHNHLPILVPPLTYDDLSSVISTKQAILLNDSSALNGMMSQILTILQKPAVNPSRWEAKRNDFMGRFNKELAISYENIAPRKIIPSSEEKTVVDKYKSYREKYATLKSEEEKEDLILIMLSEEPGFKAELNTIANAHEIKDVVCQYHLDMLMEKRFVEHVKFEGLMGFSVTWYFRLTKDGRHYLVKGGKV